MSAISRIRYFFIVLVVVNLTFITTSCEEDDEPEARSNISGTLTFNGENIQAKGGMLDEKSDSTFYRTTFEFKISDEPIHQTIRKVFEIYGSSTERINLEFKVTSDLPEVAIKPGSYNFSVEEIDSPGFPSGLVLHHAYVYVGTGSSIYNYPVTGGSVVIEGDFPDYTLTFAITTDHGDVAGTVSGEFITRASWNDYFNMQ